MAAPRHLAAKLGRSSPYKILKFCCVPSNLNSCILFVCIFIYYVFMFMYFVFICLLITLFIFASLDDTYLFRLGYFYKNLPDVQSWLGSEGVRCLYLYCYDDVEYCCCVGDTA